MVIRSVIKGFLATTLVTASFVCGFTFDTLKSAPSNPLAARYALESVPASGLARLLQPLSAHAQSPALPLPGDIYEAAIRVLQDNYYSGDAAEPGKQNMTKLTHAAIDGMLIALGDRYTEFYTPDEYRAMLEDQSGNFVGIGARLELTSDKRVRIVEPIEGSPAAEAGILPGDIIVAVDGKSVIGQPMDSVIARIRGAEGSGVRLTVERKKKTITLALKRAVVQSPIVSWRMLDSRNKVGYIELSQFNEQADVQFDTALRKLEKQGMKALVFDLRDNPGGLLNIAQDIASRFIPNGPVVWVKEKSGRLASLDVDRGKHRGKLSEAAYPVFVLVNGNSASASEIVAGAIQDSRVGLLVGTRTFGKGLVQTIIPLGDDSAVKITTQHYFTRDKHDINLKRDTDGKPIPKSGGIVPDYEVEFSEVAREAQQEAFRKNPQDRTTLDSLDPQLQKALSLAQTELQAR
ncbi:MAG: S41 family peptidase [Armatimonadaceae bacterium]